MKNKSYIVSSDILTTGRVSDAGSKILTGFVSPFAATAAQRLDGAGFGLIDQAAAEEFALTPTAHVKSAEAALKHMAAALVSDNLGQARVLSALASVSAYKPSYGVLSRLGLVAVSASMDTVALVAPTLALCDAPMRAMVGLDDADSTSVALDWPKDDAYLGQKSLAGKKIGVIKQAAAGAEDAGAVRAAGELLSEAGAEVAEVSLPDYDAALNVARAIIMAEFASAAGRYDGIKFGYRAPGARSLEEIYTRSRGEGFGFIAKSYILYGTLLASEKYYESLMLPLMRLRGKIAADVRALLQDCDALLTPVSADSFAATSLANLAGLGAVSVNWPGAGGIQLIGRAFDDVQLLQLGVNLERAKLRLVGGSV